MTLGQDNDHVYLNANQDAIPPGGSFSIYMSSARSDVALRVYRVDPIQFSADPVQAIQQGTLVNLPTTTSSPKDEYHYANGPTFTNVPAGLHVVAAEVAGRVRAWDLVQVTDVGLIQRAGASKDLVWAVSLTTGETVPGASIYRNGTQVATTDADGIAWLPHGSEATALVSDQGVAALSGRSYYHGPDVQHRVAVYTDRPLYRPGQVVHLKLVAWSRTADGFAPRGPDNVLVEVNTYHNGRESTILNRNLTTNAHGSAVDDLQLRPDASLGHYNIKVTWRGQTFYGSFEVQEYRLPKFRVAVSPNDERVAVGDPLQMLVSASRYYGEPLTEGSVHYEVRGQPWGWSPCAWCGYRYASQDSTYEARGDVELGSDGTALLRLTPDKPGSFTITVGVTARTGERIEATARLIVEPASRLVGVQLEDWVVKPGATSRAHIRLTDLDERAVNGAVTVRLLRQDYSYIDGNHQPRREILRTWTVDVKDGRGILDYDVPSAGSFLLEASASDEKGRTTRTDTWIWVSDGDWSWWRGEALQLIPEQTRYGLGDTIRVHVGATKPQPILVTLEADGVLDAKVVRNKDRSASFLAQGRHTPNVWATATQIEPVSGSTPSLNTNQVNIDVLPNARSLHVEVTPDREQYEDGETARILVQVRDIHGNPVRAEVSLVMVDEALLSLTQREETTLLKSFYPTRYAGYPQGSWQGQYWAAQSGVRGFVARADTTVGATGTASFEADAASDRLQAGGAPPPDIKVREYFPETALWLPRLQTDENGTLRVRALLPDSLTTWRVSVQAITEDGRAGHNATNLLTKRNVIADVFAPRFLTQGDSSTIQATVANYAGSLREFQTLFNLTGAEIDGDAFRTLTLSHGQSDLISFPIRAEAVGTVNITFYAWSGGDAPAGDAIRIRLPVLPHGIQSREGRAGRADADITLTIPPSAARGASHLNITLTPTIADALVEALPYLTGFPYGCVEQTLSRFLPTLAVAASADALGLNRTDIDPEIDDQVDAGLKRLYNFQHHDGAWGWWETDGTNPYTTTYVVYGLAVAKKAGYAVDARVLQQGIDALAKLAPELKRTSPTLFAYAQFALSVADPSRVSEVPAGTTATQLALATLVAHNTGKTSEAQTKAAQLANLATTENGRSHWQDEGQGWGDHGISSSTIVTALALRALLSVDSPHAALDGSARWLLENRLGGHWYTTKDTAEAVLSLAEYFRRDAAEAAPFNVTLTIDGVYETIRFDPAQQFRAAQTRDVIVEPGTHRIQVDSPSDRLYWSIAASYWDGEEPVQAKASEFLIRRNLTRVDGTPVTSLKVGEEAYVKIEVRAVGEARRYVQIVSPLPAGVEVVQEQTHYYGPWWFGHSDGFGMGMACFWCGHWSAAEIHDDHVAFFATDLPTGHPYTFQYKVRAVFPGDYHVMPPQAEEMYDPEVRGHGAEERLRIEAPAGAQFGRVQVGNETLRANVYPVGAVGDTITAYIRSESGTELSRASFSRAGAGHWTVSLPTPQEDPFTLYVQAGASTIKKLIKRAPEPEPAPRAFNASQETDWQDGPVVEVQSSLARTTVVPDYGGIFRGFTPEPFLNSPTKKRGGIDGFTLGVAILAPLVAVVALRRRRD